MMTVKDLLALNVNDHTERKANLTYLSWAWAWAEALKADPQATFHVVTFGGKPYMDCNGTALVWVTVTMFGKPMTCQLPVMDHRNKPIQNPDAFQVNTAIMRCMTKGLALHGLGLYIYAGEDLPESDAPEKTQPNGVMGAVLDSLPALTDDLKDYYSELAIDAVKCLQNSGAGAALDRIALEELDQEQKLYLNSFLDSKTRAALKAESLSRAGKKAA